MDKRVKTIVNAGVITVIGVAIPTLAALLAYGHSVNNFIISNFIFMVGILVAVAGGVWSILPFFTFKSKLRKTKMWEEVDVQKREGLMWEYILMVAGVLIVIVSYVIAIL